MHYWKNGNDKICVKYEPQKTGHFFHVRVGNSHAPGAKGGCSRSWIAFAKDEKDVIAKMKHSCEVCLEGDFKKGQSDSREGSWKDMLSEFEKGWYVVERIPKDRCIYVGYYDYD